MYGNLVSEKLDLYVPGDRSSTKLILFIHGGAFVFGDKSNFTKKCKEYAKKGYYCASLNYTLLNGISNPDLMSLEVEFAVARIQKFVKDRYGVLLDGMATYGVSAGATLALLFPYKHKQDSMIPVKLAIAMVPPVTFDPDLWEGSVYFDSIIKLLAEGGVTGDSKTVFNQYVCSGDWKKCSPACYEPNVPSVMAFGLKDVIVPDFNRVEILKKLSESGVDYAAIELPNSGHGFDISDADKIKELNETVAEYLERYLSLKLFPD